MNNSTSKISDPTHDPLFLDDILILSEEEIPPTSRTKGVAHPNPFKYYFKEIGRYPLLSEQEERSLFKRFKEEGDQGATVVLILHNLRLVVSIAKRFQWSGIPVDDLVQEGNIGLINAINEFNPHQGNKFSTYAYRVIHNAVVRVVTNDIYTVRVPTNVHELHSKMMSQCKIDPTKIGVSGIAEIAQRFAVAPSAIVTALLSIDDEQTASMNDVVKAPHNEEDVDVGWSEEVMVVQDTISVYEDDTPELFLQHKQELLQACARIKKIAQLVKSKVKRTRYFDRNITCFFHYHGLFCEERVILKDLAARYGVTKERARQIVAEIIQVLQEKDQTITSKSIVDLVRRIHKLEKLTNLEVKFLYGRH